MLDVAVPVLAVLAPALLLVTALAVQEKDGEVDHEEVGEDHAPALGLARNSVFAVAVLEEVCVGLRGGDGVLGGVADQVAGQSGGQDVGPAHEPVAEVVDVAGHAPPAGDEQARAGFGLDVLEVRDARVLRVGAEAVLLVVDGAEDVVAEALDGEHSNDTLDAEINGVDREIACLNGVGEGHPDEVTE